MVTSHPAILCTPSCGLNKALQPVHQGIPLSSILALIIWYLAYGPIVSKCSLSTQFSLIPFLRTKCMDALQLIAILCQIILCVCTLSTTVVISSSWMKVQVSMLACRPEGITDAYFFYWYCTVAQFLWRTLYLIIFCALC